MNVWRTQTHLCVTGLALASHARAGWRSAGAATALRPSTTADGAHWPRWPVEPRTRIYKSNCTWRKERFPKQYMWKMTSSHWPTCAVVSVTHFLLSAGARTLSAAALRGGVITLTCPHLNPASTAGRAFWPGSPLAPAAVDRATRKWVTLQDTCFTCTRKSKQIKKQLQCQCQCLHLQNKLHIHVIWYQLWQSVMMVSPGFACCQSDVPGHSQETFPAVS